ncbi:aldehyde dehydrogenase family protein [Amycolatopsis pigmentata]|uniref:Aldehyde dehydrogenase family protein n=1 Tax=Amycolatopsis pigmentata TaxID=450801 RepID=A0ABW5FKG5_9PSEU
MTTISLPVPDTTREVLDALLTRASSAALALADTTPAQRRGFLHTIADALDNAADELIPVARRETHLPEARLRGEMARTTFQLRLLGDEAGRAVEAIIDSADPHWPTGSRPDLRRLLVPLGPVLVFAAGNFPFAFSVAGGDTAAALAAGAPVVLKAHSGHPELSARTGEIVEAALREAGAPDGSFATVFGTDAGRDALQDQRISAGAFTGSPYAGRLLADLTASRPVPIPFYAEMGSVNPVFVTPAAAGARLDDIADGYVASSLIGAGQFCTKPGLVFVPEHTADDFLARAVPAVRATAPVPLLNRAISDGHARARRELAAHPGVSVVLDGADEGGVAGAGGHGGQVGADVAPSLLLTTSMALSADRDALTTECFGPTSLVVTYTSADELLDAARGFSGELTATVHGDEDEQLSRDLVGTVARFAGRVLWNQWPTGVAVSHAMQHGGPYPAATGQFTSVGTTSIRRFQRPVTLQNVPAALLPDELKEDNPLRLPRRVDGLDVPAPDH